MIGNRRKNRRKEERTRLALPSVNWRRWGMSAASVVGIAGVCAIYPATGGPLCAGRISEIPSVTIPMRASRTLPRRCSK